MGSNLYIVAGPNGAGKTTFAKDFLPNYVDCLEFVNADLIERSFTIFSPRFTDWLAMPTQSPVAHWARKHRF